MARKVGVLGGMGPEATVAFMKHIVELTPASSDQEHVPLVVISDPTVPDRTEFLMGRGESPLPALLRGAGQLEAMGAELIAIPCNTAHVFWNEIARAVKIPVLHIVDETLRRAREDGVGRDPIGLLATRGTISSGLYQSVAVDLGLEIVIPDEDLQERVQAIIRAIKARQVSRNGPEEQLRRAVGTMRSFGARQVILGCTELGLAGRELPEPVLDSLRILAEAAVSQALM